MKTSAIFDGLRSAMLDVMGPLVDLSSHTGESDYAVIRSILPAKTFVPLHSHPDRETILVLEGELVVWLASSWRTFGAGEIVEIRSNALHALKNEGPAEVALVLITTATMASFFAEISVPGRDAVVSTARLAQVARTASAYGYWNGDLAAQRAIGMPHQDTNDDHRHITDERKRD